MLLFPSAAVEFIWLFSTFVLIGAVEWFRVDSSSMINLPLLLVFVVVSFPRPSLTIIG
jgi:hypothetical protein